MKTHKTRVRIIIVIPNYKLPVAHNDGVSHNLISLTSPRNTSIPDLILDNIYIDMRKINHILEIILF